MSDAEKQISKIDETAGTKITEIKETRKFLSNPIVLTIGIIGSIASLISIPLAFYFYFEAKEYPQLIYYINPVKTVLVKTGEATRLTASFDNNKIESDVTVVQIALWNQGKKSIKKENVLKPIVFYTENSVPILEASIRKSSRDIVQLSLNTDEIQKGRVSVLLNILEENDGGVIQLIYAGNTETKINVEGTIEGQREITLLESPNIIKSPDEQLNYSNWNNKVSGYLWSFAGVIALLFLLGNTMRDYINKEPLYITTSFWVLVLLAAFLLFIGIFFLYISREIGPPFGF
ncbi:MAG TPA: hypothetical protein VF599_05115 [Pyrinomonadaceae bacterium]|jgi:hypothetical protein